MKKRWGVPRAKPNELKIAYGKYEGDLDLFYCHGGKEAYKCDASLLRHFVEGVEYFEGRNLRQELEHRGYDITTMKFTIKKKAV